MEATGHRSDVLRVTRWLAAAIIPFLVLAVYALLGFPDDTRNNFAWNIQPPLTAMVLGSMYAGGIWFFVRVISARHWREVRVGFPAIGAFATILGITTFLHWDRFIHQNFGFAGWTALYITTPFLVFGTWILQRTANDDRHLPEVSIPRVVQMVLAVASTGELLLAVALFAAPTNVAQLWPWALTALTGRTLAAVFTLSGLVGLGLVLDARWSVGHYLFESQAISLGLVLLSVVRDQVDFRFSVFGWLFVGGLGFLLAMTIGTYVSLHRLDRASIAPARGRT